MKELSIEKIKKYKTNSLENWNKCKITRTKKEECLISSNFMIENLSELVLTEELKQKQKLVPMEKERILKKIG